MKSRWKRYLSILMCALVTMVYSVPVFALEGTTNNVDSGVTETRESASTSENIEESDELPKVESEAVTAGNTENALDSKTEEAAEAEKTGSSEETTTPEETGTEEGTGSTDTVASGTDGNISWSLYGNGVMTIEGTGNMSSYSESSLPAWNEHRKGITSIEIKSGVTSIGSYAFYNCYNLTECTIADDVEAIGGYAFANCSRMSSITIPESVTSMGNYTFKNCTSLTDATIGAKQIGSYPFDGCTKIEEITLLDGVISIGSSVFSNLSSLTEITIPDSVTSIGSSVFVGCNKLTLIICNPNTYAYSYAKYRKTKCINHTWKTESTIDIAATCERAGSKSIHCENCTETKNIEEIPATGHTYTHKKISAGYLKTGTEYDICTKCGNAKNVKTLTGYASYVVKGFKVSKGKKSFTAKWSKASKTNQKKMDGYQVRYSTKSSMSGAKYVKASKTSKSKKVSKLSKKKTYYVQVRTYKKSGGITYYSKWSSKKKVKTK